MARDLSFWKYKKNELIDDVEVYTQLSKGCMVEVVELLPVSEIYNEIKTIFNEWKWEGEYHLELDSQVIELFITEQFVRFDCYNVTLDVMNIIIDIMNEYECPLYDSAISTRFEL